MKLPTFTFPRSLRRAALGLLLATAGAAQAQTPATFASATTYGTGGNSPSGLAVADVNGDDKPDLLTSNINSNTAGVLLNTTTITSLSPTSGAVGSTLIINGTNLSNATSVRFGELPARPGSFSVNADGTQLTVPVPVLAATNTVSVTTPSGVAVSADRFQVTRTSSSLAYASVGDLQLAGGGAISVGGTGSRSAPTVTDLDGNGLLDLLVGNQRGTVVRFEQASVNAATFTSLGPLTAGGTAINAGDYTIPTVTDLNGNGLLDLLVGNINGTVVRYEQTSTNATTFTNLGNLQAGGAALRADFTSAPTVTDLDGNGLLDLLVGGQGGMVARFEQTSANAITFTSLGNLQAGGAAITAGTLAAPTVTDLDGNGLLDLLVGGQSGYLDRYEQTGVKATSFVAAAFPLSTTQIGGITKPVVTDLNGDGLLDLLVGNVYGTVPRFVQVPAPVLTLISPTSGSVGTGVTLTGQNLSGATAVSFNGTAATFNVVNSTTIMATVPTGATTGNVTVTTPGGLSNGVAFTVTVPATVSVQYQTGDLGQPTDGQVRPFLQLVNSGTTAVPYSSLTVRYWLTVENFMGQLVTPIDYAKLGTSFVSARYVALATPRQGAYGYLEYSFSAGAGNLVAGTNSGPIYGKAYKPDYSNFDETDDWSYQTSSSFTANDHVTLYQNGTLIAGTEPPAVTATTALNVFSASRDASASTQAVSVQLQVRNTGNVPVNYADLKVRYYFTRDGASTVVPQLDYAKLGNGNISLRVVNLASSLSGADAYLEITFSAALGVFYPRTSTDDILVKLRKDNYQALDQTNDYSFTSSTALLVNNRFPAYLNGSLVFGTPPAGAPARMAASSASSTGATIVAAAGGPQALTASPNPFGEQLTLRFALPTTQAYSLAVYDGQGRLVQQVASGEAAAGEAQELAVPTQAYAAGLYLVRLTTATGVQTLKLVKP